MNILFILFFLAFIGVGFCDTILVDGTNFSLTSTGINQAISSSHDNDTVYLIDGNYFCNSSISIDKDISVYGQSKDGVILALSNNADCSMVGISKSGVTLENFTIDGNKNNQSWGNGIVISEPIDNIIIKSLNIKNIYGSGIRQYPYPVSSILIENCSITDIGAIGAEAYLGSGIDFSYFSDLTIKSCTIGDINEFGIYTWGTNSTSNSITIEDNNIYNCGNHEEGGIQIRTSNATIKNNHIHDMPTTTHGSNAIYIDDLDNPNTIHAVIENNYGINITGCPIEIQGAGDDSGISIKNNNFTVGSGGAEHPGIWLTSNSRNVDIENNKFINPRSNGIRIGSGSSNILITNNYIENPNSKSGTYAGILFDNLISTNLCSNITIKNNIIKDSRYPIELNYGILVNNGTLEDIGIYHNTISSIYGFSIDTSEDIENVYFYNNILNISNDSISIPLKTTLDYNCYYDTTGNYSFIYNGTTYNSLAAYQAATGQDTHSIAADPLLSSRYRLKPGSPAINAGVDVGVDTDYLGNTRDNLPDIGAMESGDFLNNATLR